MSIQIYIRGPWLTELARCTTLMSCSGRVVADIEVNDEIYPGRAIGRMQDRGRSYMYVHVLYIQTHVGSSSIQAPKQYVECVMVVIAKTDQTGLLV